MALARDLVELEEKLRSDAVDLFAPLAGSGLHHSAEVSAILPRMQEHGFQEPMKVLRLCLQALQILHSEAKPKTVSAELVATLPPEVPGLARPTRQVLLEMLRPKISEVILLGYELTDYEVIELLADVASRGTKVIMICDREKGVAGKIARAWPPNVPKPRVFQNKKRQDGAPYSSMHAKCLLVDGKDLLISSANFTFHGLHGNIEIGVRLSGPLVSEARKVFSHLVEAKLVEEIRFK